MYYMYMYLYTIYIYAEVNAWMPALFFSTLIFFMFFMLLTVITSKQKFYVSRRNVMKSDSENKCSGK